LFNKKEKTTKQIFYDLLKVNKFTETDRRCIKFHNETNSNAYYVLIETGENPDYKGIDLTLKLLKFLNSRDNLYFKIIYDTRTNCPYGIFEAKKSYTTYMIRLLDLGKEYQSSEYLSIEEIRDIFKHNCPHIYEELLKKENQRKDIA